jgi:transcriptional regulator with AAA-type ATPase domain
MAVRLEELPGPPFDALRQKIDQAALLGLPILLQGERGTGKTFLAQYYQDRRQEFRRQFGLLGGSDGQAAAKPPSGKKQGKGGVWFPRQTEDNRLVTVTLSEFADLENLRDTLFGWAARSWTGASEEDYDGLLGEAHGRTLFLDEIHHLDRALQAALLGPLNNGRYRPKMATYEILSRFDLVVATNDPQWRAALADDFRDRIERIVLEVPAFRSFQRIGEPVLWRFWECTIQNRCRECGIEFTQQGEWPECCEQLRGVFRRHPLPGNWRDLQRLADNILLTLAAARDGRRPTLTWRKHLLEHAIDETFAD